MADRQEAVESLVMAAMLPDEALLEAFRHAAEAAQNKAHRMIPVVLEAMDIDIRAVTDGIDEQERDIFYCILAQWFGSVIDPSSASVLVLMLRRYLIPMAEKKRSLEKAIALLGKEAEA